MNKKEYQIKVTISLEEKSHYEVEEKEVIEDKYHKDKKPLVALLNYIKENNL